VPTAHPHLEADIAAKRPWIRRVLKVLAAALILSVTVSAFAVLVFRWVPVPATALMLARRIEAWGNDKARPQVHTWVPLEEISPSLGLAVLAAEDQNFAEHFGFDWQAIEKALAHNEKSRRKRGASTVSQQTAKNLFLWEGRTWLRKGFEVWFTFLLEVEWSKRRILEVYLNSVEFGDGVFGAEAAARTFFRKPAKRLTAQESALLAAVLPGPRKFRADAPSDYIRGRQAWILEQMRLMGGERVVKDLGK
jgi:monofunctional biosynthetic peptidoglycan transglycosylase